MKLLRIEEERKAMTRNFFMLIAIAVVQLLGSSQAGYSQTNESNGFVRVAGNYRLVPNLTYLRAGGNELKLDVYQARSTSEPNRTLIYFHGGGWTNGSKESSALTFLPYLEDGWTVVNVAYRLADVAHAPAAVEDCRCALRWVYRNAERFNFDLERIVVTGNSAGGHLALTTGMLPASAGLDRQCPGNRRRSWSTGTTSTEELRVAAIINWYGITDVVDLIERTPGPSGSFTEAWLGGSAERGETAERVSPLTYVRPGLPPVMTIHGDEDPIVPFEHGARLHIALTDVGVRSRLLTIKGGGHGGFEGSENQRIYREIKEFLNSHGL